MEHHVYVATHSESIRHYVGKTSADPRKRWWQHKADAKSGRGTCRLFHRALAKYGAEAFKFQVVESFEIEAEAYYFEAWWIAYLRSWIPSHGFNIWREGRGGEKGHPVSAETRAKLSAASKGRVATPEARANMSAAHKGRPSYERTPEVREKIANSLRGRTNGPLSEEHKAKLSVVGKGRKFSPDFGAKISASKKGKPLTDAQRAVYVKVAEAARRPRSTETRTRMSEAAKKRWAKGGFEAFGLETFGRKRKLR